MIKKSYPCPRCGEQMMGESWPGGVVVIFDHKGFFEGKSCHVRMVLGDHMDGGKDDVDNRNENK